MSLKYAHVYNDRAFKSLYMATVASGSYNTGQLVMLCNSKRIIFRKSPKRAQSIREKEDFDNEIKVIQELTVSAEARPVYDPQFVKLLGVATVINPFEVVPRQHKVSYWEYADGGMLQRFIDNAKSRKEPIAQWFILRYTFQMLETLEFMYTLPNGPMAHRDLHPCNVVLHFGSVENKKPDFLMVDFGSAARIDASPNTNWDVPSILEAIATMAGEDYGDLMNPYNGLPIACVFRALRNLDDHFTYTFSTTLPSLVPICRLAKVSETMLLEAGDGAEFDVFRLSVRRSREGKMYKEPRTHSDRTIALSTKDVPGPWYLGTVTEGTWDIADIELSQVYHSAYPDSGRSR